MQRIAFSLALMCILAISAPAQTSAPVLFFTDIDSGPASGGQGGTDGAFVCVYGENFGQSQGVSTIAVGGVPVAAYPVWSDPGAPYLPGHYAKACGQISHLTPSGPQAVTLTTSAGTGTVMTMALDANGHPTSSSFTPFLFNVRSGNVYFATPSGSDTNNGSSAAPFATLKKCKNALHAGDICYIGDPTQSMPMSETALDSYGAVLWLDSVGAAGDPIAIVAYPGSIVTIDGSGSSGTANGVRNLAKAGGSAGYFTVAGFTVNGYSAAFDLGPGSYTRIVDNDVMCTGPNCSNLAAGYVTTGQSGLSFDHHNAYGNRFHDIGCGDPDSSTTYFQYSSAPHPCAWISSGTITASSSGTTLTTTGSPTGWSIPDVIEVVNPANGQTQIRRPAASSSVGCIEGASGTFPNCSTRILGGYAYTLALDQPFLPDLPPGTAWKFRLYAPAKTEHSVYFGAYTYYLDFGWNEINGNGLACRGFQIFHDGSPQNNHDIHVHDSWIHDTVCDGINFSAYDATWGPVEAYNNLLVNNGKGISDIIADPPAGGANYSAVYMSGSGPAPGYSVCSGAGCYPDQLAVYSNDMISCGITGAQAKMQFPSAVGCVTRSYDFHDPNTILLLSNNILDQPSGTSVPYYKAYQATTANTSAGYNDCYGTGACPTTPGTWNSSVETDPQFVNPTANDFHSQSSALDVSTATPVSPSNLDGQPRNGTPYRIGAY